MLAVLLAGPVWYLADGALVSGASIRTDIESNQGSGLIAERFDDGPATARVVCAVDGGDILAAQPAGAEVTAASVHEAGSIAGCYEAKWAAASGNAPSSTEAQQGDRSVADTASQRAQSSVIRLLLPPDGGGLTTGGPAGGDMGERIRATARNDVLRAEIVALPLTLLILMLVIRTPFSATLPIMIAAAAVILAVGVATVVAHRWAVSIYVVNMIVMLGLAIGIDYTLLLFERYREERRAGASVARSVPLAASSAGSAVLVSGMSVIVALAGMVFVPISVVRDLALGAILVVMLGAMAVLSLLPAVLSLLGERIDARQRPLLPRARRLEDGRGLWWRWASAVTRHPVRYGLLMLLILVPLSMLSGQFRGGLSYMSASVGEQDPDAAQGYWEQELVVTLLSVVEVTIDRAQVGEEADGGVDRLISDIGRDSDFAPFVTVQTNASGDLTVMRTLVVRPSGSAEAALAVQRLRNDMVPAAFSSASGSVFVGGPLALQWDVIRIIDAWLLPILGFVLAMSVVALTIAFRSVIVAGVATLMTLLSVAATIGVLVLVIQKGVGASLLGVTQADAIEAWVPLVLFSVLFGLSMDYHVFLVSRIQERYSVTGEATDSIVFGVGSAGRIICSAAAIMGVVFAAFAAGRLVFLQQLGLGLAVAVLIDAMLVRLTLVPAIMTLLGNRNWYAPAWGRWLGRAPEGARSDPASPIESIAGRQ